MNKIATSKMVKGTLAAAILLGGGIAGLVQSHAYAADTSTQQQTDKAADRGGKGFGKGMRGEAGFFKGGDVLEQTASLLGIDKEALFTELKAGKTLAQIAQDKAGWSEDVYLEKLTAAVKQTIADAVTAGKLTQEQADKQTSGLADRLKQQIEQTGQPGGRGPGHGKGGFGREGFGPGRGLGNEQVTSILGITQDELMTALSGGKSIAEIAADKGITEEQLIAKIKDGMTDQLKQFVERKGGPRKDKQAPGTDAAAGTTAS
ncbi:hypothetical protein J31TS4_10500 [Paenibacillus sp. J31TS4]|uniref:hypothetical protein n=1 Tax=Paenibacillus sp. J31TS4 TaxID=2807195 RepID=UPI001B0622D1|nr:hypothetical protein [Paenibacillus sp. J31TS4]GIP37770.1 hypothetical protein J31TS4_10500 [Paenibacillus sp. J31TS4]